MWECTNAYQQTPLDTKKEELNSIVSRHSPNFDVIKYFCILLQKHCFDKMLIYGNEILKKISIDMTILSCHACNLQLYKIALHQLTLHASYCLQYHFDIFP